MIAALAAFERNASVWSDMEEHMVYLFRAAKGHILEIGVRSGASTSALLAGVEQHGGHLWSVDINNCQIFQHPQWTFIHADSIKQSSEILAKIPDELDLLFVDGDHTYEGCLSDLQTYGPLAKTILIHDCLCPDTFPGVRIAAEEYAQSIGRPLDIREGSYGLGVIHTKRKVAGALHIPGWMTEAELLWLSEQAARHKSIAEIGSYQGRSTTVLAENTNGIVYAVDDWKGLREEWWKETTSQMEQESLFARFSKNMNRFNGKLCVIHADHRELTASSQVLPKADMVFIDGDHRYESVKHDIEVWLPHMCPGDLICGHDYNQESVAHAVRDCCPGATNPVGLIWAWTKP